METIRITDVTADMPEACAYCAKTHGKDGELIDLRPYGKDGQWICCDCGMKPENKATTEAMFEAVLTNSNIVVIGERPDNGKHN